MPLPDYLTVARLTAASLFEVVLPASLRGASPLEPMVVTFWVTGAQAGQWTLRVDGEGSRVTRGPSTDAETFLACTTEALLQVLSGRRDAGEAFSAGDFQVWGGRKSLPLLAQALRGSLAPEATR